MSMTKKQYRSNVIDLGGSYGVEMRLGNKIIDRAVQFSIDEVYRRYMPKRPWLWEKTQVLADGDPLNADYVSFVDAYYTVSGVRVGFRFTPLPSWAGVKHNSSAKGEASDPCFALWDKEFHTFPVGLSGISLVYNAKPVQLYIPGAQPVDTTASDIPEDADGLVIRGAFERVSILMVDEPEAFKMTQATLERVRAENMQMYVEQMERLVLGTKGGNDVAVH